MAATVREAIRELMSQTLVTMDTLLEASDRELTMGSSHGSMVSKCTATMSRRAIWLSTRPHPVPWPSRRRGRKWI